MRPTQTIYTLAALDADGYLNDATGAGPFTTILAQPGDGCSHPLTIASGATDHSTWTFTCVGTDENDNALTEVITGTNGSTATSTAYFKTLTSVTLNKTLGATTVDVGWTALAKTRWVVVDNYSSVGPLVTVGIAGTCTFTAQSTNSHIPTVTPTWVTLGSAGASATAQTLANSGTTAVRCTVASHTNGILTFAVSQGS